MSSFYIKGRSMQVTLSLPENKFIWALRRPLNRGMVHPVRGAPEQEVNLVLTKAKPTSGELDWEKLPEWARDQIFSSYHRGEILELTGAFKETKKSEEEELTKKVIKKKVTKKKTIKKKSK